MTSLPEVFLSTPIAHRALHDVEDGRPENSRAAIRSAIQHGYGIEIDLQLSSDGQAMVFHDYHLARLTDSTGWVADYSADELANINLKGGDEGIPTFAEILQLVAGQVAILVELKDQHGAMGQTDGQLERAVASDLVGYSGPLALMSFNPHMVALLAELSPSWPRGIVTCAYPEEYWPLIPDYDRCGAVFISHEADDLDSSPVARIRSSGGHVLTWTIRSKQQEEQARRFADNITFEKYLAAFPG